MSQIIVQSQKAGLPLQFLQLGGMIRYELVRYWRRRGLPLVLLLWAITIVGYIFFMTQDETLFESVSLFNQSPILHRMMSTSWIISGTTIASLFFAPLIIGIIVADTIPYEKQLGVRELQHALPLNSAIYVTGKLCGMWTAVSLGILTIALISGGIFWVMVGAFDTAVYLHYWLTILPYALITSGVCSLFVAGLNGRRRATFLAFILAIACFIRMAPTLFNSSLIANDTYLENNRAIVQAELCRLDPPRCEQEPDQRETSEFSGLPIELPTYSEILIQGVLIVIGGWFIAWRWLRWQAR